MKKIHLIFCSFIPVGLEDYVNYFINHFDNFTYLKLKSHPIKKQYSSLIKYDRGRKTSEKYLFSITSSQNKYLYFLMLPFNYSIYLYQILTLFRKRENENKVAFIGVNYFCTLAGILLKKIGSVDIVIYRVTDFFPLPVRGVYRYINRFFYVIDSFCLRNSDAIWFTTKGHIIGREKYGYFDRNRYNFKIIPLGLDINKFVSKPVNEKSRYSLVYVGVISKYHMLDLIFDIINDLKKDFNNIRLNIIGNGPDENYYKKLAMTLNLSDNIVFYGFIQEGTILTALMTDNILGLALYRNEENFMKYTEPAKVKFYLGYGIPAIISKVPLIAEELNEKKICFSVNNNKDEIVRVIKNFILDKKLQREYKKNICKYVKTINTNELLDNVIGETFKDLHIIVS
jgi:glycosyltransferase involved in cell wall biosynthesis